MKEFSAILNTSVRSTVQLQRQGLLYRIINAKHVVTVCARHIRKRGRTQMQTPQAEQVQFSDLLIKGKLTGHKTGKGENQESVQLMKASKSEIGNGKIPRKHSREAK